MRKLPQPLIPPCYEAGADHTSSWEDCQHADIFPAVYRQYRAPLSISEAQRQVQSLTKLLQHHADEYNQTRHAAVVSGLNPRSEPTVRRELRLLRDLSNRYEAVRRAYMHWIAVKKGKPELVPERGVTQYSAKARMELLGSTLLSLMDLYCSDLEQSLDSQQVRQQLLDLKTQLGAVFLPETLEEPISPGDTNGDPIA